MSSPNPTFFQGYLKGLLKRRSDIRLFPQKALGSGSPPEKGDFYFYKSDELLVPDDAAQVNLFQSAASALKLSYAPPKRVGNGPNRFQVKMGSAPDAIETVLEKLHAHSPSLQVSPNHVLFGAVVVWGFGPYGDPDLPPHDGAPPAYSGAFGKDCVVAVLDSGVPRGYRANPLLGSVDTPRAHDIEQWSYSRSHTLRYPQGHGSFVAGMVRQASIAGVEEYLVLDDDVSTDEWSLGNQLHSLVATTPLPQVVNLSLGGTTRGDLEPMGLRPLKEAALQAGGPIVVAAAGDLGSPKRFFPAACEWVIGVGAVQRAAGALPQMAPFSGYGGWVQACAEGVNVLSAFEANDYQTAAGGMLAFTGVAQWSGTSFSAPHVSAVVANLRAADPTIGLGDVLTALKGAVPAGHPGVAPVVNAIVAGGGARLVPATVPAGTPPADVGWYVP
jgi:subtilisin family serine protease